MRKRIIILSIVVFVINQTSFGQMISKLEELQLDPAILNDLKVTAKPTFELILKEKESYKSLGNSRIGGYPDLPRHVEYPMVKTNSSKGNLHYVFIAQVNLKEVGTKVHSNMPENGILYFFIHHDDESMDEVKHLVYYWGGSESELVKFNPPDDIKFTGGSYTEPFPAYSVFFKQESSIDLHYLEDQYGEYLQQNQSIYDAFDRTSRLGGHNYSVDSYLQAQIVYNIGLLSFDQRDMLYRGYLTGEKEFLRDSESSLRDYRSKLDKEKSIPTRNFYQSQINSIVRQRKLEIDKKGREKEYQQILDNWILLLAIDSIDECDMLWWDSSILEFYVNIDDLKREDFSNTFCLINH